MCLGMAMGMGALGTRLFLQRAFFKLYSRIPAIRNPLIRNLVLEFGQFHDEIAFFLITDCGAVVKSRNQASARLPK